MAKGTRTQEFISKHHAPIVTAKRLGLGAAVGIQQAGLEELDARNPNRQPNDFLALQNLIPILETAVLIPISLMAKSNTLRVIAADLVVGTAAMSAYRISKMATPIIQNQMNKMRGRGGLMRGRFSHDRSMRSSGTSYSPMALNTFTLQ